MLRPGTAPPSSASTCAPRVPTVGRRRRRGARARRRPVRRGGEAFASATAGGRLQPATRELHAGGFQVRPRAGAVHVPVNDVRCTRPPRRSERPLGARGAAHGERTVEAAHRLAGALATSDDPSRRTSRSNGLTRGGRGPAGCKRRTHGCEDYSCTQLAGGPVRWSDNQRVAEEILPTRPPASCVRSTQRQLRSACAGATRGRRSSRARKLLSEGAPVQATRCPASVPSILGDTVSGWHATVRPINRRACGLRGRGHFCERATQEPAPQATFAPRGAALPDSARHTDGALAPPPSATTRPAHRRRLPTRAASAALEVDDQLAAASATPARSVRRAPPPRSSTSARGTFCPRGSSAETVPRRPPGRAASSPTRRARAHCRRRWYCPAKSTRATQEACPSAPDSAPGAKSEADCFNNAPVYQAGDATLVIDVREDLPARARLAATGTFLATDADAEHGPRRRRSRSPPRTPRAASSR